MVDMTAPSNATSRAANASVGRPIPPLRHSGCGSRRAGYMDTPMTRLLCLLSALLLLLGALPARAQVTPPAAISAQIAQAEKDVRSVDRALDARDGPGDTAALRASALAAQQAVRASASSLQDQLGIIDARIAGLGPATAGAAEAPEIQRERQRLAQNRAAIDAAIKRGRLVDVEAQQLIDEMQRSQAEQLNETLSTRTNSPLTPEFWSAVFAAMPRDLRRVDLFLSQGATQLIDRWQHGVPWQGILATIVAAALLFPARIRLRQLGQRYLIGTAPGHRVRRSGFALWRVLVGTIAPTLAAVALVQGIRWSHTLPTRWNGLLDGLVLAAGFAAFTVAVSGAVLMRQQPSWRVAPIADETASRLRPLAWPLAAIAFASILLDAFNHSVGASPAAWTTAEVVEALLHLLWIGTFLLVLGRLRADRAERQEQEDGSQVAVSGAGLGALVLVAWLLVAAALLGLAIGYVSLSLFVARLIIWVVLMGSAIYLLMSGADDIATTLFSRDSRLGHTLVRSVGLRPSLVDQFGVLLSGTLRLILVLLALGALMSPFGGGDGLSTLFGRLGTLSQGIAVGGIEISPGAIVRAIVVLALGLGIVRAFMGWLENRYLPATDLDGSGRNSISLVARYVGIALAIIWALASLGIGVERIALLLSALSVGIGFGLQAITQNFVSGLILLAERPIKIGDLIRVGTDEGDVKRISVRSTEIVLADHSTLIVPNSELITKSVLNKTLSNPLGRIQIQFSVPLETDAERVIAIVLDIFAEEPVVLDDPQPKAFIDAITDGRIVFNAFAHVPSPRDAYGARSNLFRKLLAQFRAEGIDIGTVAQRLELAPADQALLTQPAAPESARKAEAEPSPRAGAAPDKG
jgi:small-conductance mechanosensitive channel